MRDRQCLLSRGIRFSYPLLFLITLLLLITVQMDQSFADPQSVIAEPATTGIELTAFTRARARLPLIAEESGRVLEVFYDVGDQVSDKPIFAATDTTFLQLELEEKAAQQTRLQAQISFDEREVARYQELASKSNVAAAELDRLQQTLIDRREQLRLLDIQRKIVQERIARAQVRVPRGWQITEREVEPVQWIDQGRQIGEAADFSTLLVSFALSLQQLQALEAATDPLQVELIDLAQRVAVSFYRINPGFDPATRKIAVDLKIDDDIVQQRGGLRAQLRIELPGAEGEVLIPTAAVRRSYEEYWVQPVDGQAFSVSFHGQVTRPDGDFFRVSAPQLEPGDRLLLLSD